MKPLTQIFDEYADLVRAGDVAEGGGCFQIRLDAGKGVMTAIVSDGMGWEHVSVSLSNRCPTWAEMNRIKDMFWPPDEAVMQLHPPKSDWVNYHPFCLHLWRPHPNPRVQGGKHDGFMHVDSFFEFLMDKYGWLAGGIGAEPKDLKADLRMFAQLSPGPIPTPPTWLVGLHGTAPAGPPAWVEGDE